MKPTLEEFNAYFKGKRVAVVGDAESMLGRGYGEAIDAHDVVVRFNSAWPREAYVADTGSKVNVWCCAISFQDVIRQGYAILFDQLDFIVWPWMNTKTMPEELEPVAVVLPPEFAYSLSVDIGKVVATSGLIFLAWLWSKTDYGSIDVYGFDFLQSGGWSQPKLIDWVADEFKGVRVIGGGERHDGQKERDWIKANPTRNTDFHGVKL